MFGFQNLTSEEQLQLEIIKKDLEYLKQLRESYTIMLSTFKEVSWLMKYNDMLLLEQMAFVERQKLKAPLSQLMPSPPPTIPGTLHSNSNYGEHLSLLSKETEHDRVSAGVLTQTGSFKRKRGIPYEDAQISLPFKHRR